MQPNYSFNQVLLITLQIRHIYAFLHDNEVQTISFITSVEINVHNSRYPRYAIWPRAGACHANHACAAQYPDVSTRVCFLPLKMYTGITKILEFEYKTCMF